MSEMVRRLMGQQRRRLVASMMTSSEQSGWWKRLTVVEQHEFKDRLIGCIGVYHDFMLDVVQVGGPDELRSERALEVLEQIRQSVITLERERKVRG